MYNEAGEEQKPHRDVDGEEKNNHKEEGGGRRRLDEVDWKKIAVELEKYSRQTQFRTHWPSGVSRAGCSPLR